MQTSGQANTDFDIVDLSILKGTGIKGIYGVFGITERGEVDTPKIIGSWPDFTREFGGLIAESDFPLYCRRALEAGGKLKVSRVGHYSSIDDKTSLVGTKATMVKNTTATAETRGTGTVTVTAAGADGNEITIAVLANGVPITLGSYRKATSDTPTLVAAGVASSISNGAHGYTAVGAGGVVTVSAPPGSGAAANNYDLSVYTTGTLAASVTADLAGGVTQLYNVNASFVADNIGTWANSKLSFEGVDAQNGVPNQFDLLVKLDGYPDLDKRISNIPANPTPQQIAVYNSTLKVGKIASITTMGKFAKTYATGGVEDKTLISVSDHIGSTVGQNGIYAFDNSSDIYGLACPGLAVPSLDIALAAYGDVREDIKIILRTPVGLDAEGIIDYREGTGAYNHAPVNTWRARMYTGGLEITHPASGLRTQISEIGDVLALLSKNDNRVEWFAVANENRGKITNVLGVVYNLGSAARKSVANDVDVHGINAVIQHKTFGTVIWGNSTLQKTDTLLKHANVADLLFYLRRVIIPLVEKSTFEPNDIETWKDIWRRVDPVLNEVKEGRGLWDYVYQGDQDIDDISEAKVNTPDNIDAGAYVMNLWIKPKVAAKYFNIRAVVTNSGVNFKELLEETTIQ